MGGEPLLAWEEIVEINSDVRIYCEDQGKSFKWGLTSNLIALDERKAACMIKEKASIHCSIDGTRKIHNSNRPYRNGKPSYDDVVCNVPLALSITPKDTARVTIMPEDAESVSAIAHAVLALGFAFVGLFPVVESEWSDRQVNAFAEGIAEAYQTTKSNQTTRISTILKPNKVRNGIKQTSFCGAGRGLWAFDVDGNLYHCHHFTNLPELSLINASSASPNEITTAIAKSEMTPFNHGRPAQCMSCPAIIACSGHCWANNFLVNHNASTPVTNSCRLFRAVFELVYPEIQRDELARISTACNCDSCQNCFSCEDCTYCDTCQNCYSCQSRCERVCESCDSCQTSCESSCQSRCENYCESCDTCQHCDSCQGCEGCDYSN